MKVGVLSDSHVYALDDLPKKAVDRLRAMDLIIHAGDYTGNKLLDELQELGDFKGVYGNMDPFDIKAVLPKSEVLELKEFRIGITHPSEGGTPFRLEKKVRAKFDQVDAIIYNHSHWAKNEVIQGILYFNPGSITGKFPARRKTFGVLTIGKELKGEIIEL